jgi:hypothetical protein
MKYKFPCLIFYTDKVTKGKDFVVRGKSLGFVILIGEAYKNDKGLLAHELEHGWQFLYHGLIIHKLLYHFIRRYRLWSECKAYIHQWIIEQGNDVLKDDYIQRIWLFYNLKYPQDFIKKKFESLM